MEWNYSETDRPLAEEIKIETPTDWTQLRIIRVPAQYHQNYRHWDVIPFHMGTAINVGLRRASGRFVLPIASDVFLSEQCLDFIARQNLDPNKFYRCDRYDVDPTVLDSYEHLSNKTRNNFFHLCEGNVLYRHEKLLQSSTYHIADLHTNACGNFILASKEKFSEIYGFKEGKETGVIDADSLALHALHGIGCKQEILPGNCRVYKLVNAKSSTRSLMQTWKPWQTALDWLLLRFISTRVANEARIKLNYPKRYYTHAPTAIFDSFEKHFIAYARKWANGSSFKPLNEKDWGLVNEKLEEMSMNLSAKSSEEIHIF